MIFGHSCILYLNTFMERAYDIYTFDLTHDQLMRVQERVYQSSDPRFRIIHVLTDDRTGFAGDYEDHYICLVQCQPQTATMLYLL